MKSRILLILILIFTVILVSALACSIILKNRPAENNRPESNAKIDPEELISPGENIVSKDENASIQTSDFEAAIKPLDNAEKVSDYLKKNFSITEIENETAMIPQDFFNAKTGGPQDAAVFAAYVFGRTGFEAGVLRYRGEKSGQPFSHSVAVFRGSNDVPKYLTADNGGIEIIAHGWSFRDLILKEEERTGSSIGDYAFFSPGVTNLMDGEWKKFEK